MTLQVDLTDDITLGSLRALAAGLGQRLTLTLAPALPAPRRLGHRVISAEHRAVLVRNMAIARAALARRRARRKF